MSRPLTQAEKQQLEMLIDVTGVKQVIEAIAEICHEKASHVECEWQDLPLAKLWNKAARRVEICATHADLRTISQ